MTSNEQLEIEIIIVLNRLQSAPFNWLYDYDLLPEGTVYHNDLKYDRLEQIAEVLKQRGLVGRDHEIVKLAEPGRNYIKELNGTITGEEELILLKLAVRKNDPNTVESVLPTELNLNEYDCKIALRKLELKKYVYQNSNDNQKNLGEIAWKISDTGEIKAEELKNKHKLTVKESFGEKAKRVKSQYWIAFSIIGGIFLYVAGVFSPVFTEMAKAKFLPKELHDTLKVRELIHDTVYIPPVKESAIYNK